MASHRVDTDVDQNKTRGRYRGRQRHPVSHEAKGCDFLFSNFAKMQIYCALPPTLWAVVQKRIQSRSSSSSWFEDRVKKTRGRDYM